MHASTEPIGTEACIQGVDPLNPRHDFFRLITLLRPTSPWPLLYCYSAYASSALFLVGSLYLFLPILRSTDTASTEAIHYQINLLTIDWRFTLPWWLPFILVATAAWLLALSKRIEFRIARHAHAEFWARHDALCGPGETRIQIRRRIDSAARSRAMALRWLSMCGLETLKIIAILALLCWLEPVTVPLVVVVGMALMLLFRKALWQHKDHGVRPPDGRDQLQKLLRHRVRLENARQIFYALMPITILLLLMLSRALGSLSFDLADLLFLSLLVSALGNACAGAVQMLQRLRRVDLALLELWHPLVDGDLDGFFTALEDAGNRGDAGSGEDD